MELGATFVTGAGWERPQWFEANRPLVDGVTHVARRDEWAARDWSPVVGAEHLATRERAALFDITPYVKFASRAPTRSRSWSGSAPTGSTAGRDGRLHGDAHAERRDPLRPDGRRAWRTTCSAWSPAAGSGMHDLAWIRAQVRDGERVRITDAPASLVRARPVGPARPRRSCARVTDDDVPTRRSRT